MQKCYYKFCNLKIKIVFAEIRGQTARGGTEPVQEKGGGGGDPSRRPLPQGKLQILLVWGGGGREEGRDNNLTFIHYHNVWVTCHNFGLLVISFRSLVLEMHETSV